MTERKFIVKRQPAAAPRDCEHCAAPLISAQMSADFLGFSSRIIYRLIEANKINFIETETNEIYVCPVCIKRVLETIR